MKFGTFYYFKVCDYFILLFFILLLSFFTSPVFALGYKTYEAERGLISCKAGTQPAETVWASGGRVTPSFWGKEPGDAVQWTIQLGQSLNNLNLAVRYSYNRQDELNSNHAENTARTLQLIIDNAQPIEFHVPDTGSWEDFVTIDIPLPPLSAGKHNARITSVIPYSTTNLDCFTVYQGQPNTLPPALRETILARSNSGHFLIRETPGATLYISTASIFADFERIYEYYKNFMGWEPPNPVVIQIYEDRKWPDPNSTAFQNNAGVFFRVSTFATDQGNWCHEMTHMFYVAHFPGWFDESSVQTLTTFEWFPVLFPDISPPESNQLYKQCVAEGKDVLQNPNKKYDSVNPIHYAFVVKFGPKVFSRFFHLCVEAGKKGQLDFSPGHHLKRDQIIQYMSVAAGQDVTSFYRQWTGFATAE